jgi:hypothetical protein
MGDIRGNGMRRLTKPKVTYLALLINNIYRGVFGKSLPKQLQLNLVSKKNSGRLVMSGANRPDWGSLGFSAVFAISISLPFIQAALYHGMVHA